MDAVTINACDEMIREYTRDYMEKVFYFCLKKTGSADEAEDLCSDISLAVISALKKGTDVKHFAAWVWQIAKNRYRVWAVSKHRSMELYDRGAETDSVPDDTMGVEDGVILDEDLKLLRRELAFISNDYRDVVVKFYIDDLSVKAIASALSLPEGTVKTKLFRARNILKEGMNMAREFGPKSYKPENVGFVSSGPQPSGLPHSAVQRSIPKNILLEASNNPSTVEELAIALGIAVPYMQNEVDLLVSATLLKKVGDKYITNFPIVSGGAQDRVYALKNSVAEEYAEIVDRIAEDAIPKVREMGAVISVNITDESLKWWAVCYCCRYVEKELEPESHTVTPRENGETWTFYGFEQCNGFDPFVSNDGYGFNNSTLQVFVAHEFDVAQYWNDVNISQAVVLVADAIRNDRKYDDFNEAEKSLYEQVKPFVSIRNDGTLKPEVLFFGNTSPAEIFMLHPLFPRLVELLKKLCSDIADILSDEQNSYVKEQLSGVTGTLSNMRGQIIRREVKSGRLILPENPHYATCTSALWTRDMNI